jgi:kumamolisin
MSRGRCLNPSLQANRSTGAYVGETVWNALVPQGYTVSSGGGLSQLFPWPAYQDGAPGTRATRRVPDVAADAANDTGMAMAISDGGQRYRMAGTNGTSAAAPLWAAVIALADQFGHRPPASSTPPSIASAAAPYHKAFHDITTGTNTVTGQQLGITITGYQAAPGWGPVTGWGSPDAWVLVPLLARYDSPEIGPA